MAVDEFAANALLLMQVRDPCHSRHLNAAGGLAADGDVEEHNGVGHFGGGGGKSRDCKTSNVE